VIGTIASILGVLLAIYFDNVSQKQRELHYYVNPARAIVVKTGQTSRLSITLDGQSVNRDVSAVQVAFWNEGKESIKKENILRPFVIKTGPDAPILEAKIRKQNRDVVKIKLNRNRLEKGELEIDWNILEHYDGAIIQLVYFGDSNVPISATQLLKGKVKSKKRSFLVKSQLLHYQKRRPLKLLRELGD
jgi:hypothetical protein